MIKFKNLPFKKDQVWLTSDTHYHHTNICKGVSKWDNKEGCRNFSYIEEMNNIIVNNINKYVKEDDLLIHCGDWSFGNKNNIIYFRNAISCKNIILMEGNHDHNVKDIITNNPDLFIEFIQRGYYSVEGIQFVTDHFPIGIWHQSYKNVPLYFGHVHGSFPGIGKSIDVGIDNAFKLFGEYKPFSFNEAYELAMQKETFLESHHNINTN